MASVTPPHPAAPWLLPTGPLHPLTMIHSGQNKSLSFTTVRRGRNKIMQCPGFFRRQRTSATPNWHTILLVLTFRMPVTPSIGIERCTLAFPAARVLRSDQQGTKNLISQTPHIS